MNIKKFFANFHKPTSYEIARASYGERPYYRPEDISTKERVEAILHLSVGHVLKAVLDVKSFEKLSEFDYASEFKRILPTEGCEVVAYVKNNELPPYFALYREPDGSGNWIFNFHDKWIWASVDERGMRFDHEFDSKSSAEMAVINAYKNTINRYTISPIN